MYDQVPQVTLDLSDPLWPVFAVPAAGAALSFLCADWGQRVALPKGYLKAGYVLGLLLGPVGLLTALFLPRMERTALSVELEWQELNDERSGMRFFLGQTLGGVFWVYLALLALHLPLDEPWCWPSWMGLAFNLQRDWHWHLLILLVLGLLARRAIISRAPLPLYMFRPSSRLAANLPDDVFELMLSRWRLAHSRRLGGFLAVIGATAIGFDVFAWLAFLTTLGDTNDSASTILTIRVVAVSLLIIGSLFLWGGRIWRQRATDLVDDTLTLFEKVDSLWPQQLQSREITREIDAEEDWDAPLRASELAPRELGLGRYRSQYSMLDAGEDPPLFVAELLSALIYSRLLEMGVANPEHRLPVSVGNVIAWLALAICSLVLFLGWVGSYVYKAWFVASHLTPAVNKLGEVQQAEQNTTLLIALGLCVIVGLVFTVRWLLRSLRHRG